MIIKFLLGVYLVVAIVILLLAVKDLIEANRDYKRLMREIEKLRDRENDMYRKEQNYDERET